MVDAAMQEQPDLKLALNTKLSFQSLPFHCQVDMSVFQAGKGESEMARKEGRKAFCYVELSSEQVSPILMQMSMIGSRAGSLPGQDDAPEGDFMQVMARTMSQMTRRGRYFVNMTQWAAAFWQYVPVATAYKHFDLGDAIAYFKMICAMAEQAGAKGELEIKAVVYDEASRKYVGQQAQKGDPNLDIAKEMREVNEALSEAVQIRLCTVVRNIPGAVQPSVAANPAGAGFDDQAIQRQFN